jgi:hypothetical protein
LKTEEAAPNIQAQSSGREQDQTDPRIKEIEVFEKHFDVRDRGDTRVPGVRNACNKAMSFHGRIECARVGGTAN